MICLISIEDFFKSWQIEYINLLESCNLLNNFKPDAKKLLVYFFIKNLNEKIHNSNIILYHDMNLTNSLEVFKYFDYDKFLSFFNKVTTKIKTLTGKIIIIKDNKKINFSKSIFENLDGELQDEILLLKEVIPDIKKLKEFLHSYKLSDIFNEMSWKIV